VGNGEERNLVLMTDHELLDRLDKLTNRQNALVLAVSKLTDTVVIVRDGVNELLKWAQEPPSTALADTLAELVAVIEALPERVAAEVIRQCR
jgi:hypothetical protein